MSGISEERLAKLLADSESKYATPVPWAVHSEPEVGMPPTIMQAKPIDQGFLDLIEPLNNVDKHLAVDARNALPDLITEIRRLRAENAEVRASYERVDHALRERQRKPIA